MKKSILKTVGALAVASIAVFGIKAQDWKTNPASLYLPNFDASTNPIEWKPGTNFLTITNLVYVQMEGVAIVRVTDSQWQVITNQYADKLLTNTVSFYK